MRTHINYAASEAYGSKRDGACRQSAITPVAKNPRRATRLCDGAAAAIAAGKRLARGVGPKPDAAVKSTSDQAKRSVACTSASMFSISNAEWPEAGVMLSSAFGQTCLRSHAFCSGQTTS